MDGIVIRGIAPDQGQSVVEFFNLEFVKYQPILAALGGLENSPALNLWIQRLVEGGFAFEAIDTKNGDKRVGAFLGSVYSRGVKNAVDQELKAMDIDHKLWTVIDLVTQPLDRIQQEIYEGNHRANYVEGVFLSVLAEYGDQGIAVKLFEALEEKARWTGMGAVLISATSHYTARIVARRGYEVVHIIAYEDYKQNGQRVLFPEAPNLEVQYCIKYL